jgi:hypothetical protein
MIHPPKMVRPGKGSAASEWMMGLADLGRNYRFAIDQ